MCLNYDKATAFLNRNNLEVTSSLTYDQEACYFAYNLRGGTMRCPDPKHPNQMVAFCDGSTLRKKQGGCVGGYACIFPHDQEHTVVRSLERTTNNRAECLAALTALSYANARDPSQSIVLYIYSDSKVLIDSMTKWIYDWQDNGWLTVWGTSVRNRDILELMLELQGPRPVVWQHVEAHTNKRNWESFWNSFADGHARRAARTIYENNVE
ncbi:hypothetical protein PHMEG_00032611 [Phytophthora megakarya]|uniref:ribonuclease H n=1 Tax=Phytophthora megakarya TaxID=4795 RepID=A0A225UUZ4_9STRA|nr:hypothetical protein PHMEG_00032611 [Phytophthora megakarya]